MRFLRSMAVAGVFGLLLLGFIPLGCGSRLGSVRATQDAGSIDHPNLPDITVERAKECMAEYGSQLEPGRHEFKSTVELNEEGDKVDVTIEDIPDTAPDFAACMRNVLRDIPIAEEPLRQGAETLKYRREHANVAQRSLMGSPVVIVVAGVVIVVSELALEAGAYTVLFAVTVKMADKAKDDVLEALRRRRWWENDCQRRLTECLLSSIGSHWGDVHGTTRCVMCFKRCNENGWPSSIQIDDDVFATCNYLGN